MKHHIIKHFVATFLLLPITFLLTLEAAATESIVVSSPGGTSYTIPANQTTVGVTFVIAASNLAYNGMYEVRYRIDNGSETILQDIGAHATQYSHTLNADLSNGTHRLSCVLLDWSQNFPNDVGEAYLDVTCTQSLQLTVINNFGTGLINVNGVQRNSGYSLTSVAGNSIALGAIDQDYDSYHYVWLSDGPSQSTWERQAEGGSAQPISGATPRDYTYTVMSSDNGTTLIADMRKVCGISFQNSYGGANGGSVMVNSTQYDSPTSSFSVVEGNSIQVEAYSQQSYNRVYYAFNRWVNQWQTTESTNLDMTITPTVNNSFTAIYNVDRPQPPADVAVGGGTRFHPHPELTWSQHPSSYVDEYQIWRSVKPMGEPQQAATLIATVSSTTTSYTDIDYNVTNGYTDLLLNYDVRAHLTLNATYSDPDWHSQFGTINQESVKPPSTSASIVALPTEFSLSPNFPNPFNPSTTLSYGLPMDSRVILRIYNTLGQQVAELVNAEQSAGWYGLTWNANGASGIYIYRLEAVSQNDPKHRFVDVKKMILMR